MVNIEFDKKVECGPEFVAVRILENCDTLKQGDIWLPDSVGANGRLAHCVVESIGSRASEEYGVKVGDYVMIDRLSTFAHTAPVALCRYNNIICLTDKDYKTFRPLRNMAFVEPDEKEHVSNVGGVYIMDYDEKLNTGTLTAENFDGDLGMPFKVGDRVLVVKGGDVIQVGERYIYIYKHDMLICRFTED